MTSPGWRKSSYSNPSGNCVEVAAVPVADLTALRTGLDDLHRETGRAIMTTDEFMSELLAQVVALEEILAARWPRSILVRARWRRDMRASVAHIEGSTFAWRRLNTLGSGWIGRETGEAS